MPRLRRCPAAYFLAAGHIRGDDRSEIPDDEGTEAMANAVDPAILS